MRTRDVHIGTPQCVRSTWLAAPLSRHRRSSILEQSGFVILSISLSFLLAGSGCSRKPQHPGVSAYEREMLSSMDNLIEAISNAKKSGNVVPLIAPTEKANAALTQINFAMIQEFDRMSPDEFISTRDDFARRLESKMRAVRQALSEVRPNPVYTIELKASPIKYIEEHVLPWGISTNRYDAGIPRANQWIQGGTFVK